MSIKRSRFGASAVRAPESERQVRWPLRPFPLAAGLSDNQPMRRVLALLCVVGLVVVWTRVPLVLGWARSPFAPRWNVSAFGSPQFGQGRQAGGLSPHESTEAMVDGAAM